MKTTVGQLLVNEALPKEYRNYDRTISGEELEKLLTSVGKERPEMYKEVSYNLMDVGRKASYTEGVTLSIADLDTPDPVARKAVFDFVDKQEAIIRKAKDMTEAEKREALTTVYAAAQQKLTDTTMVAAGAKQNPLALQVASKARGNPQQLTAMLSSPATYSDAKGNTIPIFVRRSYSEGLSPAEYYAATFGTRKGVVSTKFCLAEGTEVLMADYTVKPIQDLTVGDKIFSVTTDNEKVVTTVTATFNNGLRECNTYRFAKGRGRLETREVTCTAEHKVLLQYTTRTRQLKRALGQIRTVTKGRRSAVIAGKTTSCALEVREKFAFVIGAILGDGNVTQHQAHLYSADDLFVTATQAYLDNSGVSLVAVPSDRTDVKKYSLTKDGAGNGNANYTGNPLLTRLKQLGVFGKYAFEKTIPSEVYLWDDQSCREFISGLLETDGCVTNTTKGTPSVSFYCTSSELSSGLKRLLEVRYGVTCGKLTTRQVKGTQSTFGTRVVLRNHDLYGFNIATRPAIELLKKLWVTSGIKQIKLANWRCAKSYEVCNGNRYRSSEAAGLLPTYDIEVAHPSHLFVLANGMVVSNSTRDAGDFGKQLAVAAADVIVTEEDCGTPNGIPVDVADTDSIGALLAKDTGGYGAGATVDSKMLNKMESSKFKKIVVRSPITCQAKGGVCAKCVGLREDGKLPYLRQAVGIQASSALAERIAQGSLNVKHSGGQSSSSEKTYSGFDIINQIGQIPKVFTHKAALADIDGTVESIEEAPQGGTNITINGQVHYVDPEQEVTIQQGETLEAGDALSTGIANPAEIVKYKGIGEGRRYYAERLTKAFKDSKLKANRRNAEIVARATINHVEVNEPDGLGDYLPGDVVSYNNLAYSYVPRKDAKAGKPSQLIGKYLEQPYMHYSIGTRVTNKTAKELEDFGVDDIQTHDNEPGFQANMIRLRAVPHYGKDWIAKLQGSYLESNLLQDAQTAATSNIHSTHPVPAITYGKELGQSKKDEVTF